MEYDFKLSTLHLVIREGDHRLSKVYCLLITVHNWIIMHKLLLLIREERVTHLILLWKILSSSSLVCLWVARHPRVIKVPVLFRLIISHLMVVLLFLWLHQINAVWGKNHWRLHWCKLLTDVVSSLELLSIVEFTRGVKLQGKRLYPYTLAVHHRSILVVLSVLLIVHIYYFMRNYG